METLLEPEPNELFNKSGSVYVLSDNGKSILLIFFSKKLLFPKSDQSN